MPEETMTAYGRVKNDVWMSLLREALAYGVARCTEDDRIELTGVGWEDGVKGYQMNLELQRKAMAEVKASLPAEWRIG